MADTAWIALAGVTLGGALSFVSQWATQRVETKRHVSAIFESRRSERLQHLVEFVQVAQEAERFAIYLRSHEPGEDVDKRAKDILDRVWTSVRTVQMLCPKDVAQAAHILATKIHKAVRDQSLDQSVHEFLQSSRYTFLEAAHLDLERTAGKGMLSQVE